MKIRVLHLVKTVGLGGTEANLINLVSAADASRFEVHVGYTFGGVFEEQYKNTGVHIFKYDHKDRKLTDIGTIGALLRLVWYIRRNQIQIIHTHNFNAHVLGTLAARLCGVKLVEHVHDYRYLEEDDYKRRRGDISQYRYIRYMPPADRVIVLTRQNKEYLLRHRRYQEGAIREIKNGIPMDLPAPKEAGSLKSFLGIAPSAQVVLTTARLAPEKNIDLLVQIAQNIHARKPEVVFLVTGTGPLEQRLKELCLGQGMASYFKLLGFYPGDIRDLMALADVYLLPSLLELHSIAVLEAMSYPLPVVISAGVGSNNEFILHGENGILCDPFSVEGWDEAVINILENPQLRHQLCHHAHQTCRENFNITRIAQAIGEVHLELAGRCQ